MSRLATATLKNLYVLLLSHMDPGTPVSAASINYRFGRKYGFLSLGLQRLLETVFFEWMNDML